MNGGRRGIGVVTVAAAVSLLLGGCAGGSAVANDGRTSDGRIVVVASTDVWGSVVQEIGAGRVQVTSIVDSPSKDPHEYQATVRDRLVVSRAAVLVQNGGGYDDFFGRLTDGTGGALIDVAGLTGRDATAPGFNEHLWYDLPTVDRVADAVSAVLQRKDPGHRADLRAALARFHAATAGLAGEEAAVRRVAVGRGVAITEPVPLYLTAACGLVDRTPGAFASAVEDGRDAPPAVVRTQLALLQDRRVALLAVNEQTEEPMTDRVVSAARAAHVPVIGFRETLPAGTGYLAMFHAELTALRSAVGA
ncbi:zinc ABC transporter substrate-binding protein [Amnibacterium sp.]|uniref:metal ABC transporter solute-binding protein, Zn/Mn family n=1 Tax=Amnibacterium sp. TaxID=1872496 RepID=UPI0026155D1E|nr:zinc ABC transporter substrate-binding protein [Amnibacterium sp.]MCU1474213.1 transporter substrate-binding protein [Amnibacterium sp.]